MDKGRFSNTQLQNYILYNLARIGFKVKFIFIFIFWFMWLCFQEQATHHVMAIPIVICQTNEHYGQ
jgi:hypothetical protein